MPITALPTPPLTTDTPADFNTKAFSLLNALPTFVTEANALEAAVDASALSVAIVSEVSSVALSSANFKGDWSSLTGPLNIPASVSHNSALWLLEGNLADVTSAEPGVSALWIPLGRSTLIRIPRTSNTKLTSSDSGRWIDVTSGTFTQTFESVSTLGSRWYCFFRNSGTGLITLDPNLSESIDGLSSFIMYPGEERRIHCDGVELRSIVINPFHYTITASGNFIEPPGYAEFDGLLTGGGGASGYASNWGGGGGGATTPIKKKSAAPGTSWPVVIAAGGVPSADLANGGGTSGGTSQAFGFSAYGGGPADSSNLAGGGGGGLLSAGLSDSTGGNPAGGGVGSTTDISSAMGGGAGFKAGIGSSEPGNSVYGGGGGTSNLYANTGGSYYGGGGGFYPAGMPQSVTPFGPDSNQLSPVLTDRGQSVRAGRGAQSGALVAGMSVEFPGTTSLAFGNVYAGITGNTVGNTLVCILATAATNNETPNISGWTQVGTVSGGLGTGTADSGGVRRITVFTRIADGSETAVTANLTNGTDIHGIFYAFRKNAAASAVDLELGTGTDVVTGTALNITTGALNIQPGDLLIGSAVINTVNTTIAGMSFSATGLDLEISHRLADKALVSSKQFSACALVRTGSNGAVTFSGTLTAGTGNQNTGAGVVLRVRGAQDATLQKMAQVPGGGGCGMLPGARGGLELWGVI